MKHVIFRCLLAAAAVAPVAPAGAQPIAPKDMSSAIAKAIAETALETCQGMGDRVSVHVIDRDGNTIASLKGDGAAPHTYENSRRKAYTAMAFRRPTTAIAADLAMHNAATEQQMTLPNMIGLGGGLPVMVGMDVIGGVGVSGSPMGHDESCAKAGIDKAAPQLK